MAKGNLFQGQARGSIGDVVFSRSNGQQISRVRNRAPQNPKTNAQLYQRAVMATIMQAYSAGKAIFDHSFEGYKVGSDCQQRFMALNTKKLRAAIAADINAGLIGGACAGRVVGPGVVVSVPWTYQVSEGSLTQDIFTANGALKHFTDIPNETVAEYFNRMGIRQDDIFTVVAFNCADNSDPANVVFSASTEGDEFGEQTTCQFLFARLRVKPEAYSNANPISNATLMGDLFYYDLESNFIPDLSQLAINAGILQADALPMSEDLYACGTIRSRDNQDLRSTCTLEWLSAANKGYGLASNYLLEAWGSGTQSLGDSKLILEGGGVQRAAASAASQISVAPVSGPSATIYGIAPSTKDGANGYKLVALVATDGSQYFLYGNGSKSLSYSQYLCVKNGVYQWKALDAGETVADTAKVNFFADADDNAPIGDIVGFLLQQGVPSNVAMGYNS